MREEDRSAKLGGSADSSAIITGDRNTATITITNYYYSESKTAIPLESTNADNENLLCPYRGLFHFGPDDAEFFFGREVFVEELFAATQNRKFIPLLGASGSGKSSVVLAGLVPKLQQAGHWKFTHFRPSEGGDPFHALALALVPLFMPNLLGDDKLKETCKIAESLRKKDYHLSDVLTAIQRNYPQERVLLIADQFEELYTLYPDRKINHSFLDTLLRCFQSSSSNTNVLIVTMRADFLENALSYRPFADLLQNDIKLGPMNHEELSQAIAKPADKLGVTFEVGLVERILDDVENDSGNLLPLLEFALTKLWKQRKGKVLTHEVYRHIGKVQGALALHADLRYKNLLNTTKPEQVRRIFIQLVQPGEDTKDTRRLATKEELGDEASWGLVKQLADDRLVVTSCNAAGQETVEIVHEALIRNWIELKQWMDEDRSFRAWQERLRSTIKQWGEKQRDEGVLLRGAVLKEAEKMLKERREELSPGEQEFIQASVALRQRGKQRIYYVFGGVGIISLLAMGIWGWLNYTTPGQLTQIRWKLTNVSQEKTSPSKQLQAAVALVKDEKFDQALKVANQIQESYSKADALSAIAKAYSKLNQPQTATTLLEKALASANQIPDFKNKANALNHIAEAYGKLNQPQTAATLLEKALASANQIPESPVTIYTLGDIAEAIGKLNQPQTATTLLEKALISANQMRNPYSKADALGAIAKALGKLNQPQTAATLLEKALASVNQIEDSTSKVDTLSDIAEAYGKLNQPQTAATLLEKALASANQIEDSSSKADALKAIAEVYGKLNQPQTATTLLEKALVSTNQIPHSFSKAYTLKAIAEVYGKLNQPQTATTLLGKALASANQIPDFNYKANALSDIAEAYGKLNQPQTAATLLEKAFASANQIPTSSSKAYALKAIAEVYDKLNQPQTATTLLEKALDSTDQIEDSSSKADALKAIAEVAANVKNWGLALKSVQKCPHWDCEVASLAGVLTVHAEQQHPQLKEKEEKEE
jgi:tetratricopeptide (TPR) repeat protein